MSQASAENTTPTPITRQIVEAQIDLLIDMLNTMDGDADMEPDLAGAAHDREGDDPDYEPDTHDEPSLGFSTGGHYPESQIQDGPGFYMNIDAGRGLEDEHDGAEPDVDLERSMGWANEGGQLGVWYADHNEAEASSPEWPAEHPTWQPPKRRKIAPPLPTISIRDCVREAAINV